MFTQCPQCQSVLPLSATQLAEAHGEVRCGRCGAVFFALEELADELNPDGSLPPVFHAERPPTLSDLEDDEQEDDLFLDRLPSISVQRDGHGDDEAEDEADPDAFEPMVPRADKPNPLRRNGLWLVASIVLTLALGAQYVSVNLNQLAGDERWRPWLTRVCNVTGCTLPLQLARDQIRLVNRNIRPHPSVDEALIISATMQNSAEFAQPFPVIEIRLSNFDGTLIAMRRFTPPQYLDGISSESDGMAPQTLLPLVFEVIDPGQDAVAFEFSFR